MNRQATLFYNGRIYTMNRDVPRVEALLVQDGRVTALGPRELIDAQSVAYVRRVDLDGRTVIPGFNDCHCHILSFGLTLEQVDVSADGVQTIEDLKGLLRQRAQQASDSEWVIGRGYDQNALEERRHPTRTDLDEVSRSHPIVIYHTSGHALTCNSRALERAGITSDTATPSGGDIERDEHGEPNGVFKEAPAMDLLAAAIPPPTLVQGAEAITRAMEVMASQGITSASDASTGRGDSISTEVTMYRKALESGKLAGRITLMPNIRFVAPVDSSHTFKPEEFELGGQPECLGLGPTKIFSDGALTTRTAAVREPYLDTGDNGILIWDRGALASMIGRAHAAGWQIATHAIGDWALETVLDCYEQALSERPRDDHRHRVEHSMLVPPPLAARMQRLKIVPVVQPYFIGRLGDAYVAALGMERASQLIPMELFDRLGLPVAFSSDRPVIPGAPLRGIRAAIERKSPSGTTLGQEHTISTLQAIRYYTCSGAHATRTDGYKGMLRRGMMADFTVLSRDPTDTPPDDFPRIRVTMTVVGGVETFSE